MRRERGEREAMAEMQGVKNSGRQHPALPLLTAVWGLRLPRSHVSKSEPSRESTLAIGRPRSPNRRLNWKWCANLQRLQSGKPRSSPSRKIHDFKSKAAPASQQRPRALAAPIHFVARAESCSICTLQPPAVVAESERSFRLLRTAGLAEVSRRKKRGACRGNRRHETKGVGVNEPRMGAR